MVEAKFTLALGALMALLFVPQVSAENPLAPLPPSSVQAVLDEVGVLVEWTPPFAGASEVAYYVVYRDGVAMAQVEGTSFVDLGGTGSSLYAVASADSGGAESAPVLAVPPWMGKCIHIMLGDIPPVWIDPIACIGGGPDDEGGIDGTVQMLAGERPPSVKLEIFFL